MALDLGIGSTDTVSVYGRNAADAIETTPLGFSQVSVGGLAQAITIQPVDAGDNLTVSGEGGADTLIANATSAQESLDFNPVDSDTGNLIGAGPTSITADTMEQVVVDGQGGNDTMMVTTPAGAQDVSLSPGQPATPAASGCSVSCLCSSATSACPEPFSSEPGRRSSRPAALRRDVAGRHV